MEINILDKMDSNREIVSTTVLHWNYRGFTEFPLQQLTGEESDVTDIYLKENLISRLPSDIGRLENLESLYLSGNDITELPNEISKLRCLKCLDVSGNRLKCVPEVISEVRGLKFLILDENEISELPLRIVELRALRYLSVCDNKLRWLPQKPVYNYHHCEFRFWRNADLKSIPYSLWYHMLRDQQTRSVNVGCLNIQDNQRRSLNNSCRFRLKINQDSREWDFDVHCPSDHRNVLYDLKYSPPSLYELSKRKFYQIIHYIANVLSVKVNESNFNNNFNIIHDRDTKEGRNVSNLSNSFKRIDIGNEFIKDVDENGNKFELKLIPSIRRRQNLYNGSINGSSRKISYVPADVIEEFYSDLPSFIKVELCNGPISRCENIDCKQAIFDYVTYEFCLGKITLIENTEDVILSAVFCSRNCASTWKKGKNNLIPWTLK